MKIVAISGSVRPDNFTWKALTLAVDEFQKQEGVELQVFDPREMRLALPGLQTDDPKVQALRDAVKESTGIVLATPEYHGGFSSVIKMVIENLGYPSALSGKPIALLGVAAGQIGAIKALEHLRSVCSHVGAIVLPGPVSVANVHKLFDQEGRPLDESMERRIRGVATHLLEYIHTNVCPRVSLEHAVRGAE
jgi:FMN reductase